MVSLLWSPVQDVAESCLLKYLHGDEIYIYVMFKWRFSKMWIQYPKLWV